MGPLAGPLPSPIPGMSSAHMAGTAVSPRMIGTALSKEIHTHSPTASQRSAYLVGGSPPPPRGAHKVKPGSDTPASVPVPAQVHPTRQERDSSAHLAI